MQYLVLADVHGNLPALNAVLAHPAAAGCDRVVSLGDHTGFGPQPRQVQEVLTHLDALMLRGNHEDRLLHIDEPRFSGYNWTMLHWTRAQLDGLPLTFPLDMRIGPVLLTHSVPGDPFRLMDEQDVPPLLAALPEDVRWYLSGHIHTPWFIRAHGRTACNPGSVGLVEDGVGGTAPFAVLDVAGNDVSVTRYATTYDKIALRKAFVSSGCTAVAPEMCRVVLETMENGTPQAALKLVQQAASIGREMGLSVGEQVVWQETARRNWPDDCATYWTRMEASLS